MTRRTLLQRISIVSNRKHPATLRTAPWDEVEGSKFSPPGLVSFMASIPSFTAYFDRVEYTPPLSPGLSRRARTLRQRAEDNRGGREKPGHPGKTGQALQLTGIHPLI